jgi:hypothetical protein
MAQAHPVNNRQGKTEMKRLTSFIFLLLQVCAVSAQSGKAQDKGRSVTGKEATEPPSATYVACVVSLNNSNRDTFLTCMQRHDLKIRRELKRKGLLSEQSVFETTSIKDINTPGPVLEFPDLESSECDCTTQGFFPSRGTAQ